VERLNQRMLEAEQLAAVGQLAASVAHEIGAPLTAITMAVEQLLKRDCDVCGFGERDLQIVLSQTHRISRLTRRLVELARPGIPVLQRIDLNDVVRDTLDLLDKQLKRSHITAKLELADQPCAVKADPKQVQQALLNLLLNAEHALNKCGGGLLLVRTRRIHNWIELLVADTGPGIDPEDLPKVFLPFFSRSDGTGLGLATVRQIIHGHGGTVEVESVAGQGAAFTVRLPEGTDE
jgi:signal transduction histidine kinase